MSEFEFDRFTGEKGVVSLLDEWTNGICTRVKSKIPRLWKKTVQLQEPVLHNHEDKP